jgi:hypothetical protein
VRPNVANSHPVKENTSRQFSTILSADLTTRLPLSPTRSCSLTRLTAPDPATTNRCECDQPNCRRKTRQTDEERGDLIQQIYDLPTPNAENIHYYDIIQLLSSCYAHIIFPVLSPHTLVSDRSLRRELPVNRLVQMSGRILNAGIQASIGTALPMPNSEGIF